MLLEVPAWLAVKSHLLSPSQALGVATSPPPALPINGAGCFQTLAATVADGFVLLFGHATWIWWACQDDEEARAVSSPSLDLSISVFLIKVGDAQ